MIWHRALPTRRRETRIPCGRPMLTKHRAGQRATSTIGTQFQSAHTTLEQRVSCVHYPGGVNVQSKAFQGTSEATRRLTNTWFGTSLTLTRTETRSPCDRHLRMNIMSQQTKGKQNRLMNLRELRRKILLQASSGQRMNLAERILVECRRCHPHGRHHLINMLPHLSKRSLSSS